MPINVQRLREGSLRQNLARMSIISLVVSCLALAVAALTAWLTLLRRGTIKMTQPTQIYFGPDGGPSHAGIIPNKVYLRTLLYSTAKRGQRIESMWLRLRRGETSQNFNVWVTGEQRPMTRGSGLFVGESGVAAHHTFLPPMDGAPYDFAAGLYSLEVFATLVGRPQPISLFSTQLTVTAQQAHAIHHLAAGLFFEWGPDAKTYHPVIDSLPRRQLAPELVELFAAPEQRATFPQRQRDRCTSQALRQAIEPNGMFGVVRRRGASQNQS